MSYFVNPKGVFVENDATTKKEVLEFIANKAVEIGYAREAAPVVAAFCEREELGATGLQDGFAIPHAKSEAIEKPGVIVVKLVNPIEWASFDGKQVDIIISLLVPKGAVGTTHIKLLSKLAILLMREDFRDAIRATDDATKIAELVNKGLENA